MYGEMSAEVEVLEFLYALVRLLKPDLCVETGAHRGLSAWHIGRALRENGAGRLVTCEIDGRLCEEARERCAGLPVEVRCESSLELEVAGEIDFLFIDSDLALRVREVRRFLPALSRRAVVALHDTAMTVETQPELARYQADLTALGEECALLLLPLPTPRGLTLARRC
jgi:predicted O-methyltransferase YrrM